MQSFSPNCCSYNVTIAPLDYTTQFIGSDLADYIQTVGSSGHTIGYNPASGYLEIGVSGSAWQTNAMGRGQSPYAIRKIPDGAAVELGYLNCSTLPIGATIIACGLVVYNAGSNTPLFTWMLGTTTLTPTR